MSLPAIPALATIFAPAAGGAAAGWATLAGGVISGIGSGLMEKKARKDDERERIAEDEREKEKYTGAGEAVRFWDQDQATDEQNNSGGVGPEFQRADAQSNNDLKLGQREQRQKMGQQFRNQNRKPQGQERFKYDRDAQSIVPA